MGVPFNAYTPAGGMNHIITIDKAEGYFVFSDSMETTKIMSSVYNASEFEIKIIPIFSGNPWGMGFDLSLIFEGHGWEKNQTSNKGRLNPNTPHSYSALREGDTNS